MDLAKVRQILKNAWQPITYSAEELGAALGIRQAQAMRMILDINAGLDMGAWVTHHDLVSYLKDLVSISNVPDSEEELSVHGRWLIAQGWAIHSSRQAYRWIDPEDDNSHYTLKAALNIELDRQRELSLPPKLDPNIIDAEFQIRK